MATDPAQPAAVSGVDDLAQVILAYNRVTEDLQRSHESLRAQVERLQSQLASADAQLQRSKRLAALGEMAAGIAHEVRNPLAAIHLYAKMLVEDLPDGSATQQTAGKIADAVRGLNAVVTDVLHFSRELRPRVRQLDTLALLQRAAESHRPEIDAGAVALRFDVPDECAVVDADPDLLHQALLNLIRNAVEAGAQRVTMASRFDGPMVVLAISDDGPGIPDAAIDRIFNPFFTTRDTGTGLGLAIVHRIIDAHGGAIRVHNAPAPTGGAVFEILLPQNACNLASPPTPHGLAA